ncbi:hypothetical protein DFP97_10961 [Paenibacillus prosopidis]|uniref:Uncharacterized protein n=1 Tax=Paenibacillus prosopidis TaxID=630520 RepID=A0A368VZU5_9BACL|nr:hypothetical protein DFP97_10961 [Paenibacillus prosopidis]
MRSEQSLLDIRRGQRVIGWHVVILILLLINGGGSIGKTNDLLGW